MDDLDEVLDGYKPVQQRARAANVGAADANPDQAAKAITLAPQVGLPPAIVQYDLDGIAQRTQTEQNNQLTDANPKLAEFVSDPVKAAAVKDDYQNLATISNFLDPGGIPYQSINAPNPSSFPAGVASGYEHQQYGRLAYRQMKGEHGLEQTLKEYERGFAGETDHTGFDRLLYSLGGLVGSLGSSVAASPVEAAGGAAVGSVAPGVGTAAGFAAGTAAGVVRDTFISTAGQTYRQLSQLKDKSGNYLPDETRKVAALVAGGLNATLMVGGGAAMRAGAGAIIPEALEQALANPTVTSAIMRGVTGITAAGLEGGVLNTAMELSQAGTMELAKTFSGQDFNTAFNDPDARKQLVDRLSQAFVDGAALFGTMHALPVGVNYLRDRTTINQTRLEADQRKSIVGAMQVSETMKRAPELMHEYIASHDYPDIQIPAEIVQANRAAFDYVPDIDQHLEHQFPIGGDITIPAADYFTRTPPELMGKLNENVRGLSGLTPEDAKGLESEPPYGRPQTRVPGEEAPASSSEPMAQATETVANSARRAMWLDPILNPDAAGLRKLDFARYSKLIQDVQRDLTKKAYDVAEREIRRRETPLWKADLAKEAKGARTDLEMRPDIKAYDILTTGKKNDPLAIRLNRNDVDALLNRESSETAAEFQKSGRRASEALPDKMFAEDGLHPDSAAELLGYSSGTELLSNLRDYSAAIEQSGRSARGHFESLVADEARRRMEEKHGDLQEKIMREAIEEALSVKQIDVLIEELKGLGADEKITRDKVTALAADKFSQLTAKNIKSTEFQRRVGKYGQEAERALLADKPVEAFQAKQRQLINFAMAREALQFERERAAFGKLVDRYSSNRALNSVDQGFTDQVHAILYRMETNIPRSAENLSEALGNVTLDQFVTNAKDTHGLEVVVAPGVMRDGPLPRMKDMTVAEMRDLHEAIQSLNELGRKVRKVEVTGRVQDFEDAIDPIYKQLDKLEGERDPNSTRPWDQLKTVGRKVGSALFKVEQVFMWADKDDPLGPLTSTIYRPLKEALHARDDHLKELAGWWKELPVDNAWRKSLREKITNKVLEDEDGRPMPLSRKNMIAIALNTGNETNFRVLTQGRNWRGDDVTQLLRDNMTKQDWDVVQGVWDITEKLWPDIKELSKRITGVAVEKVPARVVQTPHGEFRGGYFPLMQEARSLKTKIDDKYDRPFLNLSTISSATQARTGAVYPLDLNLDRLAYTLRETVHDIHFREPVAQAAKFIQDKPFRAAFDKAFGPEFTDQLKPWLSYIANDGGMPDPAALGWLEAGSRYLRQNMVTMLVGARPSTAMIHSTSALANSVAEIMKKAPGDAKYLLQANQFLHINPFEMARRYNDIIAESGELRNRIHNIDRDLGQQVLRSLAAPEGLARIGGDPYYRQAYQTLMTKLIASTDLMSATVVYAAKKAEMLDKGMSMEDAKFAADQAVRVAHGSMSLMDLPAIARQNEAAKWFTTFYGYFNHNFQRIADSVRKVGTGEINLASTSGWWNIVMRSVGYLVVPALIHEVLRHDKKQGESWGAWGAKAMLTQIGGGMPIERDIMRATLEGKKPDQISPLTEVLGGMTQPFLDAHKYITKGEVPKDWLSHAMQTPGWFVGHLPGVTSLGTAGRLAAGVTTKTGSGYAQYIWDKAHHVPDTWDTDYLRLITDGNYHRRKQH